MRNWYKLVRHISLHTFLIKLMH